MPEFAYRAARADGSMTEGQIGAVSLEVALRQLQGQGLTPVSIGSAAGEPGAPAAISPHGRVGEGEVATPAAARSSRWRTRRELDQDDVRLLTNDLAVMLRAGLPLDRALRIQAGAAGKPAVVELVQGLLGAVKGGSSLSQGLQARRELFGDFYLSMVRSGEASGQLGDVLGRLAAHLERMRALRESVVAALIYPAILVVVALLSVVLMLGFVVPQFETLFNDMGEALPLPTRIIVGLGHGVADWGWLGALLLAAALAGLRAWWRTPAGRGWRDRQLLALPLVGELLRKLDITRFARSMGTLLGNGVAIVAALRIATDTLANTVLRQAVAGVETSIRQGGRMARALEETGLFSALAVNLVRLGEETGRLDEALLELARIHDDEVQSGIRRLLALLEPTLILGLGGVIAAIIVSILMGILSINELAV